MAITLEDLAVTLEPGDRAGLLEDWDWLLGPGAQVLMVTVAGDAFVQLPQAPGVHWLDCASGVVQKVADDLPEFLQRLTDADFVAAWFRFDLVAERLRAGRAPDAGQVLGLRVPLVLGGAMEASNLEPVALSAHFALTGQVHAQVAALAPGQALADISLATE